MKLKLLNAIKCDLNKSIINIGFAGAVLLTTVLAFTSSAYTDLATDKSYSVFESLFTLDKNILISDFYAYLVGEELALCLLVFKRADLLRKPVSSDVFVPSVIIMNLFAITMF
jgi:uncharacterized PurR-regulated membrane protein YhhQ (DUF165 family)